MEPGPRVYLNAGRRHAAIPKDQQLMARGINKVILVGNLGNDPEVKYTQGGMAITKASLATTSVRKDRDGNTQEKTEWHRVTFFGKLGEIAGEYLRKGSQVYVEGEIRYSEHTGDDGQKRYYTDIVANEMQMLGGRGDRAEGGERPARSAGGPPQRREPAPARQAPKVNEFADDFADDDIPF
jgi:single-strand DNA-binding protein